MKYAGIINNDVVNGQDVCVSYWCQGCRFRCPGCQNPQTWDFDGGIEDKEENIINNVIEAIEKNGIHRNLSILGGEPLCDENLYFTYRLINKVIEVYPSIRIFIWTGYKWEDLIKYCEQDYMVVDKKNASRLKGILSKTELLIDGQFDLSHRDITLPFRGSNNQRIIDVQKSLISNKVVLWQPE